MNEHVEEMIEILINVAPRFNSFELAYVWYRTQFLPGFGDQTAEQLVQDGRAIDVFGYLDGVDAGTYA